MIFGGYPSGSLGVRLTIEPPPGAADADGDGVADSLEAQCGLSSSTPDTDHDTIPDALELFGNNGFSFSAGSVWGDAPVRRNVYVEIDTMNNSAAVKPPYPGFPGDVQYIFSQNGTNPIDVYVEPESSPSLPYSPYIAYPFSVCLPSNCQLYGNLKTSNFSIGMPERQPYFHYFVFGDRYTLNDPTCATGAAQLLSQDGIVTIGNPPGTTCTGRGPGFPNNTDMLGTFVHELGHNLNLTHNENNDPNGAFSVIHVSVMNYRYQLTGVPGLSGILASTYSYGNNSFAPCYSSPKYRCELDALAAYAQYGDATVCAFFDPLCDTDVNEWNSWITTDFVHGARNPGPGTGVSLGASGAGVSSAASSSSVPASVLASLQPGEFAPFHDAIVANIVGATAGPLKGPERDPWVGPVPDVQPAQRKRLVEAQVSDLQERGLVAGKDFSVSADGLAVTQTCMSR
jgi:hypothetical protein